MKMLLLCAPMSQAAPRAAVTGLRVNCTSVAQRCLAGCRILIEPTRDLDCTKFEAAVEIPAFTRLRAAHEYISLQDGGPVKPELFYTLIRQ